MVYGKYILKTKAVKTHFTASMVKKKQFDSSMSKKRTAVLLDYQQTDARFGSRADGPLNLC